MKACELTFPPGLSRPPQGCPVPSWVVLCKGFIDFHVPQRMLILSLSLFSLHFRFHKTDQIQDRGFLSFKPPSIPPPILVWSSSPGKLGWYSRSTIDYRPFWALGKPLAKKPFGESTWGAPPPPSFKSLSLFAWSKKLSDDLFLSTRQSLCHSHLL